MVSSGTVSESLNSLNTIAGSYSSEINGLTESWKGPSYDSLTSQAETFVSDYISTIATQMNAFATACDLYEQYKTAKYNLEVSEGNYQKAVSANDNASANEFAAAITTYNTLVNQLKSQIEAQLTSAASDKLTATSKTYAITADISAAASADSSNQSNNSLTTSITGSTGSSGYSSSGSSGYSSSGSSGGGVYYTSTGGGGTSYSVQSSYSGSSTPTINVSGEAALNGNVIDTSQPVGTGAKYNLSESELNYLAYVAMREQGSVEGAKLELSLMANLYEKNKSRYSSVTDYVQNSGWFGTGSTSSYYYPGDEYVAVARDVLVDGNRYLDSKVVEHDCLSDISYISTGSSNNRNNYIPGETVIHNVYGADYVFVGFAPNGGDPFGYLV